MDHPFSSCRMAALPMIVWIAIFCAMDFHNLVAARHCGKNDYSHKPISGPEVCLDCPDGKVMPLSNHTERECLSRCDRGQYLSISSRGCQPCPEGTFMHEDKHEYLHCNNCPRQTNKITEKIIQNCNKTHPTIIGCADGYYRRCSNNIYTIECQPCRSCATNSLFTARKCDQFHDSVCCQQPDMTVVDTMTGPKCESNMAASSGPTSTAPPTQPVCDINSSPCAASCFHCPDGYSRPEANHCHSPCKKDKSTKAEGSTLLTPSTGIVCVVCLVPFFLYFLRAAAPFRG